ncbi:33 kDa ribonucleoprotein, chloroplastic-like [Papaver somniferum]|uniref:33 kDa ribonucleoprotein, chloroplastic-like n=1 Tax=Papaver somniferum TaxID=3469 RepID=UPI000E6FF670|nr:33 kDa ribonucleoprotein, chloroplastic-like [Papaver somniferum]
MAAPFISMAAATTSISSVRLIHRIVNITLDFSPITLKSKFTEINPTFLKFQTPNTRLSTLSNSIHCHDSTSVIDRKHYENEEEDEDYEDEFSYDDEDDDEDLPIQESSRLYVGNLPYSVTSAQLTDIFNQAGQVSAVEIVYDRVTDRSRGFAFVTMGTAEQAKEAIRMFAGSQIGGRTVKVNFPEVPRGGEMEIMGPKIHRSNRGFVESPYKIYAGNLAWTVSSEGLKDAFANQPGLLSAKVIYDRDSGKARGFGFVTFSSAQDAQSAIDALNGVEVQGRPLRLNLAAERAKTLASQVEETKSESDAEIPENAMQPTISIN